MFITTVLSLTSLFCIKAIIHIRSTVVMNTDNPNHVKTSLSKVINPRLKQNRTMEHSPANCWITSLT